MVTLLLRIPALVFTCCGPVVLCHGNAVVEGPCSSVPAVVLAADRAWGGPVVLCHGNAVVEDPRHVQHILLVLQIQQTSFHFSTELRNKLALA
jgi:hypothetical protein